MRLIKNRPHHVYHNLPDHRDFRIVNLVYTGSLHKCSPVFGYGSLSHRNFGFSDGAGSLVEGSTVFDDMAGSDAQAGMPDHLNGSVSHVVPGSDAVRMKG